MFESPSLAVYNCGEFITSDTLLWETGLLRELVTSESDMLKEICTQG